MIFMRRSLLSKKVRLSIVPFPAIKGPPTQANRGRLIVLDTCGANHSPCVKLQAMRVKREGQASRQ